MLSWASLVRLLRRRLVLGFIFLLSLTYCGLSLFQYEKKVVTSDINDFDDMDNMIINDNIDLASNDDLEVDRSLISAKPEFWPEESPNEDPNGNSLNIEALTNTNNSEILKQSCRNSIQGKALIVDERGIVCARREVSPNGCCSLEEKSDSKKERYSCKTCNTQGCCAIYEYCVSCCLHPTKHSKSKKDAENPKIRRTDDFVKLRLRNLDKFQVCLAICRTSSASVRHENTYKDPHSKHCYYNLPYQYQQQRYRRDLSSSDYNKNKVNDDNNERIIVDTSFSVVSLFTSTTFQFHDIQSNC